MEFTHAACAILILFEQGGDGREFTEHGELVGGQADLAVLVWMETCENACAAGRADSLCDIGVIETRALGGEFVDVWGGLSVIAVAAEVWAVVF